MLLYNIETMAKKMKADFEGATDKIDHMGLRGSAREEVLKDVICQLIPEKFRIGDGVIVDIDGTQSKQQDLFVYDAFNSPVFLKTEKSLVVPVESVYSTIEIKSTLTKETLRQSIANIRSVKMLKHTELMNSALVSARHNYILGAIFAYTSDSSITKVAYNVEELCADIPKEMQPSMICVFDKGLVVNVLKNNVHLMTPDPSEMTMWGLVEGNQETNLYLFYLLLQQHLSVAQNFPPDLMKYAAATHKLDDTKIVIPKEMIPDDMRIEFGKNVLEGEEIRFIGEHNQLIFKILTGQMTAEEFIKTGMDTKELEEIIKRFMSIIKKSFGADPVSDMMAEDIVKKVEK